MTRDNTDYTNSREWAEFIENDPNKNCLQFPSLLEKLGDIHGNTVLEIGCGTGELSRIMAENGAVVFAFDKSKEQIAKAQALGTEKTSGRIWYAHAEPTTVAHTPFQVRIDSAVANNVLHYARNPSELLSFFNIAAELTRSKGRLVGTILNPEYKEFGTISNGRRITEVEGNPGRRRVEFFLPSSQDPVAGISAEYTNFEIGDYMRASSKAGFKEVRFSRLETNRSGKFKGQGECYWENHNTLNPMYLMLEAVPEKRNLI